MPSRRRLIEQTTALARVARAGAGAYGTSPFRIAARARRVRRRGGFEYEEALLWGLLDPGMHATELDGHVSKHAALEAQRRVNPEGFAALMEEKAVFYRYCAAVGLPTPLLLALVGTGGGWAPDTGVIRDAADFRRFILHEAPEEIVVKPSAGVYGEGVQLIRRAGGELETAEGAALTIDGLFASLTSGDPYGLWVVQERLRNSAEVARLGSAETLQTLRIATLVRAGGAVEVLSGSLRLAARGGSVDNYRGGVTGNGSVNVTDLGSGRLGAVRTLRPDGLGAAVTPHFPATGARVEGVVLEGWPDAVALVRRAAPHFLPTRAIGWDVALVPGGPVIVEANPWWDPPPTADQAPVFARLRDADARAAG